MWHNKTKDYRDAFFFAKKKPTKNKNNLGDILPLKEIHKEKCAKCYACQS